MKFVNNTPDVYDFFSDIPDGEYFIEQGYVDPEEDFDPNFGIYFKNLSRCYLLQDNYSEPIVKECMQPEGPFVLLKVEFTISVK